MEREVAVRAGMFATIIVLVGLIFITASSMPHSVQLASLPELIVAMTSNQTEFVIDVTGALQATLYASLELQVNHINPDGANVSLATYARNDSYNAALYVPANETPLWIHTRLVDQQGNYFEYNMTVQTFHDSNNAGRLTMVFNFPDPPKGATQYRVPPSDLRQPIPRRGTIP